MKVKIDWFTGMFIVLSYIMVYMWGQSNSIIPKILVYQRELNHVVKMDTCRVVGDTAGIPLAIWYNDFIFMPDTAMMNNF